MCQWFFLIAVIIFVSGLPMVFPRVGDLKTWSFYPWLCEISMFDDDFDVCIYVLYWFDDFYVIYSRWL